MGIQGCWVLSDDQVSEIESRDFFETIELMKIGYRLEKIEDFAKGFGDPQPVFHLLKFLVPEDVVERPSQERLEQLVVSNLRVKFPEQSKFVCRYQKAARTYWLITTTRCGWRITTHKWNLISKKRR